MLQADRDPDQPWADPQKLQLLLGDIGVGHPHGLLDEALGEDRNFGSHEDVVILALNGASCLCLIIHM